MKIQFAHADLASLREAGTREWLDTNGCGGFASGTVANWHTRKYHGLLAASLTEPAGTFLLLSQLEDWIEIGDQRAFLVTHQYGETISPDGHLRQELFEQELCPAFTYRIGDLTVTRRVMLVHGQNTALIRYDTEGTTTGAVLTVRPLLAYRSIHKVTRANAELDPRTEPVANGFSIQPYRGMPRLWFQASVKSQYTQAPLWYYQFHYPTDAERGFEHREDLFTPGIIEVKLRSGQPVVFAASTAPLPGNLLRLWQQEELRRQQAADAADASVPDKWDERRTRLYRNLRRTARQFQIELPGGVAAIHAGYHWFGPWGRDTLIALPGLVFQSGDLELGVRILKAFAHFEKKGLLPNFINADGSGAYTAADPSLWFFWTVQQYLKFGGSLETVRREFWPTMLSILRHFIRGTENGIVVDLDGLVRAGSPATAVTWMDAQVGGRPIIPRWGYMVEINALWYNAVCFTLELARKKFSEYVEELDSDYGTRVQHAFVQKFWLADQKLLLDSANEYCSDSSLRPNVIFAVSLPYSPLNQAQQRAVVQAVRRELFTPYGLRSLTPNDMRYHGICQGENWVRELAYHQGSVWPWFLAHFAEALFRAEGRTKENKALFAGVVDAFEHHLHEAGVGSVSEVFDGDAPHLPRGAISQAWNVAEVLRLLTLLD